MWHALRAELAYLRPSLLGSLGIALLATTIMTTINAVVGGPPAFAAAAIRGMFWMMAPLIVAFVVQAYRTQERRTRLLLAGPLTPRQLALVSVLLPVALGACGTVAAGLSLGIESAITGAFAFETLHIVGYVGGQLLLYTQMGLLLQEAIVSSQQRRLGAAVLGWATLLAGALLFTALSIGAFTHQGPWTWPLLNAGNLVAAVTAMVVTVLLHTGRSDFTR
jgi:hypothetical protein